MSITFLRPAQDEQQQKKELEYRFFCYALLARTLVWKKNNTQTSLSGEVDKASQKRSCYIIPNNLKGLQTQNFSNFWVIHKQSKEYVKKRLWFICLQRRKNNKGFHLNFQKHFPICQNKNEQNHLPTTSGLCQKAWINIPRPDLTGLR